MNRFELYGAALLLSAALGLAWHGQPSAQDRLARLAPRLDERLASEEVRIDPGELYDLMGNEQLPLALLDLRSEADYNLFHLRGAQRVELAQLGQPWVRELPSATVIVVMSNDEQAAEVGFKLLAAQGLLNAYLLGGGINFWLDVYRDGQLGAALPARGTGDDTLRQRFSTALGAGQPATHPDPLHPLKRACTAKVKAAAAAERPSGGCG